MKEIASSYAKASSFALRASEDMSEDRSAASPPRNDKVVDSTTPHEKEFSEGQSIYKIATGLNNDKVPTKKNRRGGWNISTISQILKNKKYIGIWEWRRIKNVTDPMTGKRKQVLRHENERMSVFRENLVIIDKYIWDKVQKRLTDLKGTWPVSKKRQAYYQQKSYIHTSPT